MLNGFSPLTRSQHCPTTQRGLTLARQLRDRSAGRPPVPLEDSTDKCTTFHVKRLPAVCSQTQAVRCVQSTWCQKQTPRMHAPYDVPLQRSRRAHSHPTTTPPKTPNHTVTRCFRQLLVTPTFTMHRKPCNRRIRYRLLGVWLPSSQSRHAPRHSSDVLHTWRRHEPAREVTQPGMSTGECIEPLKALVA